MPPKQVNSSLALDTSADSRKASELVRSFIRGDGEEDIEAWLEFLRKEIPNSLEALLRVVEDIDELINVRAMAARLLMAGAPDLEPLVYAKLRDFPSPLIRLGVALGLGDCGRRDRLKDFLNDPVPLIVEEAEDLLEDG